MPWFQPPPAGFKQMWRLVIGSYVIPLSSAHSESNSDGWRLGYRVLYHGKEVPAGMNVEVQSILSPMESVDFFIKPPEPQIAR